MFSFLLRLNTFSNTILVFEDPAKDKVQQACPNAFTMMGYTGTSNKPTNNAFLDNRFPFVTVPQNDGSRQHPNDVHRNRGSVSPNLKGEDNKNGPLYERRSRKAMMGVVRDNGCPQIRFSPSSRRNGFVARGLLYLNVSVRPNLAFGVWWIPRHPNRKERTSTTHHPIHCHLLFPIIRLIVE